MCLKWSAFMCFLFHLYPRKLRFWIWFITAHSSDVCQKLSTIWQDVHIILHAHFTTSSSICRPIWRYWDSKMMVRYFLSQVCVQDEVNSFFSVWKCIWLCVFSLPISLVKSLRICEPYLSVIMKLEVWPNLNCSGSWSTMMRCEPFSLTHECHLIFE